MKTCGELCLEQRRLNTVWKRESGPTLQLTGVLPSLQGCSPINAYYRRFQRKLEAYCRRELLPLLPEAGPDLTLVLSYRVHYASGQLLSITCDLHRLQREYDPAAVLPPAAAAARFAAVWDPETSSPVPLTRFLAVGRCHLLRQLALQARSRLDSGTTLFYPDCAVRIRRCFCSDNFYLREDGLVIFYPPLSLGPRAEGVPQFFFPWTENWLRAPEESGQRSCIPLPLRAIIPSRKRRRDL